MTITLVSICIGLSFLIMFLLLFSKKEKHTISQADTTDYDNPDEWLYSNFLVKLYNAMFSRFDPVELSKKLGLEYDKYMINCNIIGKTPNFKKECMMRILGLVLLFVGIFLSVVFFNVIPLILGMGAYLLLVSAVTRKVASEAERKRNAIVLDLPRFLDLLLSALEANLPIDIALVKVVENAPCTLSSELKVTIAEMQIGAKNWQQALEEVAYKYEIDLLSDFVLDVITSYNKGLSVAEAIARKTISTKQSALLHAKERVAKTTTSILVPIVIFKIIPLLAIMLIPIAIQILTGFG